MILPNLSTKTRLKKTVALLVALSFVFSNVVFADIPKNTNLETKKQAEIITDPAKIIIPRDYGLIKSRYTAKDSKKLIIHIQDAHCNYEAQSNIIKILECLIKNDSLSLVSVEGADGFIDTSWFKAFPDADIRKEVADYFMKKGEITGPEFLSITSDYPVKLFGAETRSYYIENLNAFTSSYPLKEDTEKYFNQIKTVINKLKNYIYSDDLKEFDAKSQDYESKKISFTDYVKYLELLGEKHKVGLRQYENLFKLISVFIYEKRIDFSVVDKERSSLIDVITKRLDKEKLTELVNKSLEFKVGKITSVEYYNYLKALSAKYGISLSSEYPNLFNYIIYNSVYSRIENEQLFNDIKKFEEAVKEKIFANDDQRTLEKLSRHINILIGLVNIKLLNGDFEYYKSNKEEFSHEAFADFIEKMATRYGFAYEVDAPSEAVRESTAKLEDFYAIAIKRDKALVDNTLQAMRKEEAQISVLVTGGFHSEGITKLLEKQNVSYIVVCPNITKDVESPYIKILTNQRTPLEEILSDTGVTTADAKNVKSGMLAPYLITDARIDIKALQGVKEIADRAEDVIHTWAKMQIKLWLPRALEGCIKWSMKPTPELLAIYFNRAVDAEVETAIRDEKVIGSEPELLKKNADSIKKLSEAVIKELLAPQTTQPAELAVKTVKELIEVEKNIYAKIAGRDNREEGYKLSVARLASFGLSVDTLMSDLVLTIPDRQVVAKLIVFGKGSIFRFWKELNPTQKREFIKQLKTINIDRVEELHQRFVLKRGKPFAPPIEITDENLSAPDVIDITKDTSNNLKAKDIGEAAYRKGEVACLELAGGTGSRQALSDDFPKIMVEVGILTNATLAKERLAKIRAEAEEYGRPIPLIIMTSDVTHAPLTKFFNDNIVNGRYFGEVPTEWVMFVPQIVMPQMTDNGEYILKKEKNKINVGGFGHGDARDLILQDEKVLKWLKTFGIKYILLIQVDNAFKVGGRALGHHILSGKNIKPGTEHVSAVVMEKRSPDEKVGLALKINKNLSIVEYTDIPPKLLYKMYVYVIDGQEVIFIKEGGNYIIKSHADVRDMIRIMPEADITKWVTEHCVSKDNIPEGVSIGFLSKTYTDAELRNKARLWLGAGSINQLIWTLSTLIGKPALPPIVQRGKTVEGYDPATGVFFTKPKSKTDPKLLTNKFERFDFDGWRVNPICGTVLMTDRGGESIEGGFAPIKDAEGTGRDTVSASIGIKNRNYQFLLKQLCGWTFGAEAVIELTPAFAFTDGRYLPVKIKGKGNVEGSLRLSGRNTTVGDNFNVGSGGSFILNIADEYNPNTEVIIGKNVTVKPGVKVEFNIRGTGKLIIEDNTIFDTGRSYYNIREGKEMYIAKDRSVVVRPVKAGETSVGAIRANGGELTKVEHGTRGATAEKIKDEKSVNGAIASLIVSRVGRNGWSKNAYAISNTGTKLLQGDVKIQNAYDFYKTARSLGLEFDWVLNEIQQANYQQLLSMFDPAKLKDKGCDELNLVMIRGLKKKLAELGVAQDVILHPGITRKAAYIDEEDFLYLLSLKNGVELIIEGINHEMKHINNPRLSEEIIEVLAPSHDVRLALLMRDMLKTDKTRVDSVYQNIYKGIVEDGKEFTSQAIADKYKISVNIATALLDKVAEESGYNILKREMYQSVIDNTPEAIKNTPLVDMTQKGKIEIKLTKENLADFDAAKDLVRGMNLKSWLARYRKEASVSTAGIRGLQNILFPNDPRELIGQKAIILATVAKALVAQDLKAKGYPDRELHKIASCEVRFNSKEYVEFISRIQAALGIKTHIPVDGETIPIWMASFLIFKYDLMGGEYVTSSHAISKKTATKDLNDQGSQYIPEESKLFVDKIDEILKTIEQTGEYAITLAPIDDANIDQEFMRKINNGIDDYVRYLQGGIGTPNNLELINEGKNKIFIDVVGGCMYRTMRQIFEKLGILNRFEWLHTKEDPYFHGIGKPCYRLNTDNGKLGLEDLTCDTSIVVINSVADVERIKDFAERFKDKIAEKAVGMQILIPVPNSNNKIFGQIRSADDPELKLLKNVIDVKLNDNKVLVFETGIRILPVIKTMGYKKRFKDVPTGTVVELTDPDGDRLITAQIVDIKYRDKLEKLGLAYEILDNNRVLVVFMPNQSFLMTIDFRKQMLKRDGEWDKRNWFMIKTTASAAAWDDWAAAQSNKSYKIKYAGTNEWVEAKGVPVVNTPVGFKEIASIMKKVEKQMRDAPNKEVIIEDIFGNQINLGVQPRLLFAGEESGGEIFGPTELIDSANGRKAIAMREKSAGEAMVITSAMAADLEGKGITLVDYIINIFEENNVVNRFDYREDIIYFNESEPDVNVRKKAEAEGLKMKEENDFFFLAIAIALRDGKITFDKAKEFLEKTFPAVDFKELKGIYFVGDGVYLKFSDRVLEIRPSGTEAKTKGYAMGASPATLVNDAKALAGYYSESMRDQLVGLLGRDLHAEYFKDAQFLGTTMPYVKARAMKIYNEYLAKDAETEPFVPPSNYDYLTMSKSFKQEKQGAVVIAQKLHTPLKAADAEMAKRFLQGGYGQSGYGVPEGAAVDGSFATGKEGSQGYFVNGGKEAFLSAVKNMTDFFQKRERILLGKPIKYVIKPGIGGQHTPFQGIADIFQVIDLDSGVIVGEYELGKDYEAALVSTLKKLGADWEQIAVIPSSKSGSTDETMMIFSDIFYVLLKHVFLKHISPMVYSHLDDECFAQIIFDTLHEVNFINGKERPAKDLFKVDRERFGTESLIELVDRRAKEKNLFIGKDTVKKMFGIVLGNMFFETTDRPEASRLSAFIHNSGLDKELDENAPGFGAMFDNVGGRWTADLHMMTFLAYHRLDAEAYWQSRYIGMQAKSYSTFLGTELGNKILDEGIKHIALVVPDEAFWFGKAMEQNFNESIWQEGFANLVAIKQSDWDAQKQNYINKPDRLVIDMSRGNISTEGLTAKTLFSIPNELSSETTSHQELAGEVGALYSTFYRMTHTVGNRLIARALDKAGYKATDVDINDLDNPTTRIVQRNLYLRQPYVELGKGLLEKKLKTLQEKGPQAIKEELGKIKKAAITLSLVSNIGELEKLQEPLVDMRDLAIVIRKAVNFAEETDRKFVPFIYLEGKKYQEIRARLTELGIEWVLQGTGDQHINYQQVLAQPQKYLPFIISFVPDKTLPGRPAIGFAKGYLHNVSPHMVRDLFAEASYKALTEPRKNEAGEEVKGAAGIFLRMVDSETNHSMLLEAFKTALAPEPGKETSTKIDETKETSEHADHEGLTAAEQAFAKAGGAELIEKILSEVSITGEDVEKIKSSIKNESIGLRTTLNLVTATNTPKKLIVLGRDTGLDPESNAAAQAGRAVIEKYLGDSLIEVRGKGSVLLEGMKEQIAQLTNAGKIEGKDFVVVTIAGDATLDQIRENNPDLKNLGKILNISNIMNTDTKRKYLPIIGLYDLAIRIAYITPDQDMHDILLCLNRIASKENGQPFTKDEIEKSLAEGLIRILPRTGPVNMTEAVEAYKAAEQVLRAL